MASTNKSIDQCREHSEEKCYAWRQKLAETFPPDSNDIVLVCGSYARKEAGDSSDVDYFLVSEKEDGRKERLEDINKVGLKPPSAGGPFAGEHTSQSIIQNIGGTDDSNDDITRRMLLLLEGDWLFNREGFRHLRRQILERYVGEEIPDHHIALFLLNDIIRYWRTICVDYEYKTTEKDKPWAIRNVKLVFSRKLLYASGLFSVALTADMSRKKKVDRLEELFDLHPLKRIVEICGEATTGPMLRCYDFFLGCITDDTKRCRLETLDKSERNDPLFREIKNEGYRFTRELLKLFETTFHSTHPIRRAIIY